MVWARLDDAILDNPKILKAGVLGFAMHVAAITWSSRNVRNGFIPTSAVRMLLDLPEVVYEYIGLLGLPEGIEENLTRDIYDMPPLRADKVAALLVNCGLWEEDEDGYMIHDFLEYNPSADEVAVNRSAVSQKRSEAGKKGAARRWGDRLSMAKDGDATANGMASAISKHAKQHGKSMANGSQTDGPGPVLLSSLLTLSSVSSEINSKTATGETLFELGAAEIPRDRRDEQQAVFDAWVLARLRRYPETKGHPCRLDDVRRAAVDNALDKFKFSVDDLKLAVAGFVQNADRDTSDTRSFVWALSGAAEIEAGIGRALRIRGQAKLDELTEANGSVNGSGST